MVSIEVIESSLEISNEVIAIKIMSKQLFLPDKLTR